MEYTPSISVIIPVYKAEKYLHRCVDSFLKQTFSDFEVLLIDDGSPDNSGKICDAYSVLDKRIKVFHKTNGAFTFKNKTSWAISHRKFSACQRRPRYSLLKIVLRISNN